MVHFGTDEANLEAFTGESGDVNQELTGDTAYVYNHVTITGLEPNTTYYYTVEKNGEQTEVCEYTTQDTEEVKILYVGDPQIGASKGQTQDGAELTADETGAAKHSSQKRRIFVEPDSELRLCRESGSEFCHLRRRSGKQNPDSPRRRSTRDIFLLTFSRGWL